MLNLQRKLRKAGCTALEARLAGHNSSSSTISTLISILCNLAYNHQNQSTTSSRNNEPDPKRPRTSPSSAINEAILECIRAIDDVSRVDPMGIRGVASTISQRNVFGTSSSRTEDPIEAARALRNHESTHQQKNSSYPITFEILKWFKRCVKLLVHQRTVVDLKDRFDHFDEDGDGSITRLEFLHKLQEPPFDRKLSSATLRQLVAQFDQDGDDEVDFSEFVAFYFTQQSNMNTNKNNTNNPNSNVENISSDEIGAANDVANELRHLFIQFTGRSPDAIASENMLLYKITSFVVETFVEHSNWRFYDEGHKHDIGKVCLETMHWILSYGDLGTEYSDTPTYDAREFLLEALLEDRGLQHRLMSSVTGLLINRRNETNIKKLADMTKSAFDVLLDILKSDDANTPSERSELAQSKLKLVAEQDNVRTSPPTNSDYIDEDRSKGLKDPEAKFNAIVTISGYVLMSHADAHTHDCHRLRILAMETMKEMTSILAIVGASSQQSTVGIDRFTMLRRLQNQGRGGNGGNGRNGNGRNQAWRGGAANGNNLAGGVDRLLTEDTLSSSFLSFFSEKQKIKLREDLFDCVDILEENDDKKQHKENAKLSCAIFAFVNACFHNQPNFGNFLLGLNDNDQNTAARHSLIHSVLKKIDKYYVTYPSVLASWYGLINDIWDQGHGKRDRLLNLIGDQTKQDQFWQQIAFPLLRQETETLELKKFPLTSATVTGTVQTLAAANANIEVGMGVSWDDRYYNESTGKYEHVVTTNGQANTTVAAISGTTLTLTNAVTYVPDGEIDPRTGDFKPQVLTFTTNYCDYCYRMEVCAFSLRLIASQMVIRRASNTSNSSNLEDLLIQKLRKSTMLDKWFKAFCCVTAPSRLLTEASKATLQMGVNLVVFEQLPVPPPGSRTYGTSYVYDAILLNEILKQNFQKLNDIDYTEDLQECIEKLKRSNKRLGVADAQVFAIQSLKQFMEVYCMRPKTRVSNGENGNNGNEEEKSSTRHILKKKTLDLFCELSVNRSSVSEPIVLQELIQLLLILLHKKIFGSSPPMNNGTDMLIEWKPTEHDNELEMKDCEILMKIMEAWCIKVFGHRDDGGNNGMNEDASFNTNGLTMSSSNNSHLSEHFQIESVRPLLASCVLVLHVIVERQRNSTTEYDGRKMSILIHNVVRHVCMCVEHVGAIIAYPNQATVSFSMDELHVALQSGIALLSVYVSQQRMPSQPNMELLVNTLRYPTLQTIMSVLWSLLSCPAHELDVNPNASSTALKIIALVNELVAVKEFADAVIEMGFLTHLLECSAFRHFQAEAMEGDGQGWSFRGYDTYDDRREVHRLWCATLALVPALLNSDSTSIGTRRLAFGQVLDVITIYECSFVDLLEAPLQSNHRFSRASLMETRCAAAVIASLVKDDQNAQRWRLAKPIQFERFIHGLLRVVSSMAMLVRLDTSSSNLRELRNVQKRTKYVSTSEQHEKILKLHEIHSPMYDASNDDSQHSKANQIRQMCKHFVMETKDYVPNVNKSLVFVMDHFSGELVLVEQNNSTQSSNDKVSESVEDITNAGKIGILSNDKMTMHVGVFENRGIKKLIGAIQVVAGQALEETWQRWVKDKATKLRRTLSFQIGEQINYRGEQQEVADVGEIVQVIDTQQGVSFRVRFEKRFLQDCLNDATAVLEVVLPLICLPSLSPFNPKTQRGLVEITFEDSQREKLDIAHFCFHKLAELHERHAKGKLFQAISNNANNDSVLRIQFWRYVRSLSQSLYLFWNHLDRTRSVTQDLHKNDMDDASFGKHQMNALVKMGIINERGRHVRRRSQRKNRRGKNQQHMQDLQVMDVKDTFEAKMKNYLFISRNGSTREEIEEDKKRQASMDFLSDVCTEIDKIYNYYQRWN